MRASYRGVCCFFLALLFVHPAHADYASKILSSNRSFNNDIIIMMADSGIEEALEIASALGRREDYYIVEIISFYYANYWHNDQYKAELILSTLFHSLFNGSLERAQKKSRFLTNRGILILLLRDLGQFQSPDLKRELIRIISYTDERELYQSLALEGKALAERMAKTRGHLSQNEVEEALVLLNVIETLRLRDMKELCLDFVHKSYDKKIVTRARAVAQVLH